MIIYTSRQTPDSYDGTLAEFIAFLQSLPPQWSNKNINYADFANCSSVRCRVDENDMLVLEEGDR